MLEALNHNNNKKIKSRCEITQHFSRKLTHSNTQEGNDTAKCRLIAFANQRNAGSPENNRWTRSEFVFEKSQALKFYTAVWLSFFFLCQS